MKFSRKSNAINYEAIYQLLTIICIGYFILVYMDFFLLFSQTLTVGLLFLSIGLLGMHFVLKSNLVLLLSFLSCLACIWFTYSL